jgi:hypothetical protein
MMNDPPSVRLSGAALAQLLSHTMRRSASSNGEDELVEGLLFGIYRERPRQAKEAREADDSDELAAGVTCTEIEVEGCVALGVACSFYAPNGAVHLPTIKALVARLDASATVVGWFRCKMRPMTQLTLRETAVLRRLQALNPRLPLVFASVATHHVAGSSLSLDYRFVTLLPVGAAAATAVPSAVAVSVSNLQQSSVDAFAAAVDHRSGASLAAASTAAGVAPSSFGLSPHVARLQASTLAELKARVDAVHELNSQLQQLAAASSVAPST